MGCYSDSMDALIARLKGHRSQPEYLLASFNFAEFPQVEGEGDATMPDLRVLCPDLKEEFRERDTLKTSYGVKLLVSTARSLGVGECLKAIELVVDAIELIPGTLVVDPHLSNTLRKPIEVEVRQCIPSTLALNAVVELTLYPLRIPMRGRRRS